MTVEEYRALKKKHRNKYGNEKATVDGLVFDSKKEARRYSELRLMERAGLIKNLVCQKRYELTPPMDGKIRHYRPHFYVADFWYLDKEGHQHIEDVKSKATKTKEYCLKRALVFQIYGSEIEEIE